MVPAYDDGMTSPQGSHLSQPRVSRRVAGQAVATVAAAVLLAACGDATGDTSSPMADHGMTSSSSTNTTDSTTTGTQGPSATAPSSPAPTSPTSTASAPGSKGTPAAGPHNTADVEFASGMVPHHQQAVGMAAMALRHGGTPDFVKLAKAVKAAQAPEIEQMSGWLVGWGEPVPDASSHTGHTGAGMMSQKDLDDLDAMMGSGFEGMWLTLMVKHHQGALDMARAEVAKGRNAEVRKLAQSIITSQTAEIATMRKMADARAS